MLYLTGCASIISGRTQEVTFKSDPPGATVIVGGRELGRTPVTFQLDRKRGQTLMIQKDGYKTETLPLETTMNGWFWGNFLTGGLVGSTTDSLTGAITEYSPSMYTVTLKPSNTSVMLQQSEVRTYLISNYKSIVEELNTKPGQYIESLWTLLKIAPDKQANALTTLKSLAEANKDIADFADKVVEQVK